MFFKCNEKKNTFSGRIVVGTLTGDDMGGGGVGSKWGLPQHLLSKFCFKRSYGSLTCKILCQVFSSVHSFWRFFSESGQASYLMQIYAFETWKQCQWIVRILTRKHKIWRGWELVIFETLFKSLPSFQCSWNLQSIFIDDWSQDCQVCKKKESGQFAPPPTISPRQLAPTLWTISPHFLDD